MIEIKTTADKGRTDFIIMPNQAMSWRGLMAVYIFISSITLSIGIFFYFLGLTLILPFSGLDVVLLGIAFYLCAWRGGVREVVSIDDNQIIFERGRNFPERRSEFQRAWAKVVLERSKNSWYPSRLLLRSHGRQLEVGRFLNEQERQGLAHELINALKKNN